MSAASHGVSEEMQGLQRAWSPDPEWTKLGHDFYQPGHGLTWLMPNLTQCAVVVVAVIASGSGFVSRSVFRCDLAAGVVVGVVRVAASVDAVLPWQNGPVQMTRFPSLQYHYYCCARHTPCLFPSLYPSSNYAGTTGPGLPNEGVAVPAGIHPDADAASPAAVGVDEDIV